VTAVLARAQPTPPTLALAQVPWQTADYNFAPTPLQITELSEVKLLNLPEPRTDQLEGSPLELVVCQLQFAESVKASSDDLGEGMRDALSEAFGEYALERFAPQAVFQLAIGQGAPTEMQPASTPEPGWRLNSGPWSVTITGEYLTIETSAYSEWPEFRRVFEVALDTVTKRTAPKSEQRLGLRYVNRIERKDVLRPSDWTPWIQPWILGSVAHEGIGEAVLSSQQQIDFDADEGLRTTLRSAIYSDAARRGRAICLLDFDSYRLGYRRFKREDILATSDKLRRLTLKMFQASITEDLYKEFAGA
jgi:uncharacterized protein (TIGR04255 family)